MLIKVLHEIRVQCTAKLRRSLGSFSESCICTFLFTIFFGRSVRITARKDFHNKKNKNKIKIKLHRMDSFLRQLDKGLDSLAGKMDQLMSDRASGGLSEEGVGDVYIVNNARYRIIKKLAEGSLFLSLFFLIFLKLIFVIYSFFFFPFHLPFLGSDISYKSDYNLL